jgi:hypothetical protein
MLRKLALVGLVLCVGRGSVAQLTVAIVLSFTFFACQMKTWPCAPITLTVVCPLALQWYSTSCVFCTDTKWRPTTFSGSFMSASLR